MNGAVVISREEARSAGLRRFFTGISCRNGHISERQTGNGACVACGLARNKKHYQNNRDQRGSARTIKWRTENPDKYRAYRDSEECRRAARRATQRWQQKNRDAINAYRRAKTESDVGFRLRINLAGRIGQAVRYVWGHKSARTLDLIGCSIEELRAHLESLFSPGMSWENYGYGDDKWHIDHIRPCALFDLTDADQQRKCFHFTNLQPLWQPENFKKNSRFDGKTV
jgi:hypothetical protein